MNNLKLGKLPATYDQRTLQLQTILKMRELPPIPKIFDCDTALPAPIPLLLFGNNKWGDCVIAARANQTLRLECFEQKKAIPISDSNVLNEYWKEQGAGGCLNKHPDRGLNILNSLTAWRKGWKAAGQTYNIYAFGEITSLNHPEVLAAIYLLNGAIAGLQLPVSAQAQFESGQPWDITSGPGANPGSWGGHCIYLPAYNDIGPICETWAKKQQMTWAFWDRYNDECWGIVDDRDKFVTDSPVDVEALDEYLNEIKAI
jgi:hypothetical protein